MRGRIDIVPRRSHDGGRIWTGQTVIAIDPPHTTGNPTPVVDRRTGRIHLLFCKSLGVEGET